MKLRNEKKQSPGHRKRWLWGLAVAFWTAVIWGQSLLPAAESSAQSRGLLQLLMPLLTALNADPELLHILLRKLAHFLEFALLGVLWVPICAQRCSGMRSCVPHALLYCCLTAMADEGIQRFVPGRSGQWGDVLLDVLGAAAGIAIVCLGQWEKRNELK